MVHTCSNIVFVEKRSNVVFVKYTGTNRQYPRIINNCLKCDKTHFVLPLIISVSQRWKFYPYFSFYIVLFLAFVRSSVFIPLLLLMDVIFYFPQAKHVFVPLGI